MKKLLLIATLTCTLNASPLLEAIKVGNKPAMIERLKRKSIPTINVVRLALKRHEGLLLEQPNQEAIVTSIQMLRNLVIVGGARIDPGLQIRLNKIIDLKQALGLRSLLIKEYRCRNQQVNVYYIPTAQQLYELIDLLKTEKQSIKG